MRITQELVQEALVNLSEKKGYPISEQQAKKQGKDKYLIIYMENIYWARLEGEGINLAFGLPAYIKSNRELWYILIALANQ